jgi:hypothetical protein
MSQVQPWQQLPPVRVDMLGDHTLDVRLTAQLRHIVAVPVASGRFRKASVWSPLRQHGRPMHELATNAAKRGPRKEAKGRLDVSRDGQSTEEAPHPRLDWRESGVAAMPDNLRQASGDS